MDKTCYNCGTEIAKEYCEGYPEVCEHWSPKKPMPNGDKIRQMTDEELANFIFVLGSCPTVTDGTPFNDNADCSQDCEKCWLDWLRKEAEA